MTPVADLLGCRRRQTLAGAPEGWDAVLLAAGARSVAGGVIHVARDDVRLATMTEALHFFAPDLTVLDLPAWDTMPYDRVSPRPDIAARRLDTLARLAARGTGDDSGLVVVTTVAAATQKVPGPETFAGSQVSVTVGRRIDLGSLTATLARGGYGRADQVMEPGEYAIRGGILDVFPAGAEEPVRIDLFGDDVEQIRPFDPVTQRSSGSLDHIDLLPVSEVLLDEAAISRFRSGYRGLFGAVTGDDPLYEAVSEGRRVPGMEHWLPLFHDGLDPLFAFLPEAAVVLDHQADQARAAREEQILDYHRARQDVLASGTALADAGAIYHPIPPETLFLLSDEWQRALAGRSVITLDPFDAPDVGAAASLDGGGRPGRDFADVRARSDANLFDHVVAHVRDQRDAGRRVVLATTSDGARHRIAGLLRDHGLDTPVQAEDWAEVLAADPGPGTAHVVTLPIERGFVADGLAVISEQDILGDRLSRQIRKSKRKAEKFIADASQLADGDLVVHTEHGIGRYDGLETLQVGGAAHDCLRLIYADNDKLYVPVENIEVLSRYGTEQAGVTLDKLGGVAWQARKSRLKNRIRDMADQLIRIAAERHTRPADKLTTPEGLYDEFCARFPYAETDDQLKAIGDAIEDLGQGRPMDRLVCGDVGFGKTEVALRAAFVAAMSGRQVAVVVPTTLLARQHYNTFRERFEGLPVQVAQLSRLVTGKAAAQVKKGVADGTVDIVIGTHALLAKSITFGNLGLLIVDEEQHFGVAHKERLKQLRADVHVLTLTATPIPRTLQMALTGVRELSIIATPPVDRLAVRTFVLPFDGVVIREAILRERFRGGQTFYVVPRIADIDKVLERLGRLVPEAKVAVAHGQMAATQLESVIGAFADGEQDILVSTNIIESGLDMPRVNTIVIHRAEMFGLAQLYQLRGRVGRAKLRGYAYLTVPSDRKLPKTAERRLQVMQTLDSLGAGFSLASHDLDIRGAGNLLGDEQSGHIKEVGIELYQHLLEEAVATAKAQADDAPVTESAEFSPTINVGMPVLIPETYVPDLGVRLALYRRIADVADRAEADTLAAEMIDRFGKLPVEVENLLEVVTLKGHARRANVEKLEAGPKGAVLTFRDNQFPNPAGLVQFIARQSGTVKLRPDHRLVYMRTWDDAKRRVAGLQRLMEQLATLAVAA